MGKIERKVVCDGIRIDKNIIPSYLQGVRQGTADFSIEYAFYSGQGERCQSGSCNKKIHNIYVVTDNATGVQYKIGSECVKKYQGLEQLIGYWKTQLEKAKGKAVRVAKKKQWQEAKQERARQSQIDHEEELRFIEKYFQYRTSRFLESIQKCFNNGWELSDKQAEVFENIKNTTNFDDLARQSDQDVLRFDQTLETIEKLDRVSFGQYPSRAFSNIRAVFAERGAISEKQLELLEKLAYRFRRQIDR